MYSASSRPPTSLAFWLRVKTDPSLVSRCGRRHELTNGVEDDADPVGAEVRQQALDAAGGGLDPEIAGPAQAIGGLKSIVMEGFYDILVRRAASFAVCVDMNSV